VTALLLSARQFGLGIIFGSTSIGDPDSSVVHWFLPFDVSSGRPFRRRHAWTCPGIKPENRLLLGFSSNQKSKEPGYIPSSCERCAERISVVGTRPHRLRYCCNGQTLPYRSDPPIKQRPMRDNIAYFCKYALASLENDLISSLKQRGPPGGEFLLKSSRACPLGALDSQAGRAGTRFEFRSALLLP
jgi:hypothetical protein